MEWAEAKDVILGFLISGLMGFLTYEVHALRVTLERALERLESHDRRITRLEEAQ